MTGATLAPPRIVFQDPLGLKGCLTLPSFSEKIPTRRRHSLAKALGFHGRRQKEKGKSKHRHVLGRTRGFALPNAKRTRLGPEFRSNSTLRKSRFSDPPGLAATLLG